MDDSKLRAVRNEALEDAAKVIEQYGESGLLNRFAGDIRSLKSHPAPISAKAHWERMTGRADARADVAAMQSGQDKVAVERAARAMALHVGWDKWDTATDFTHTQSGNDPDDERDYFRDLARAALKSQPAAELDKAGWIGVDERLPEVDVTVLVYAPPQVYDWPDSIRISFDCIDPNDDDHATWLSHNEHYEHFCCVAKPEGCVGPSEKAPYTHWMPLPAAPEAAP